MGVCNTAIGGQGQSIGMYAAAVDPRSNCGLASALCSRMLTRCPGWAWLNRFCEIETVVGWLVSMVLLLVRAQARAERCYRLLSCPVSAAAAVEQLGAALAMEQLEQPAAKGAAAWQPTAAAVHHQQQQQ